MTAIETPNVLKQVDLLRKRATGELDQDRRSDLGQVMTPPGVARLMASMFSGQQRETIRLLDPGAGIGSLTAAAVTELLARDLRPASIEVTAYEVDATLIEYLARTLELCKDACRALDVAFHGQIEFHDFLAAAGKEHLTARPPRFTHAILNPPYRKIRSGTNDRENCRVMGLEVTNLYAGFVGATTLMLEEGGELVAITPRSFANGPYFRAYRGFLLSRLAVRRLHVFGSRRRAFADDDVLQENVIVHAQRTSHESETVEVTASAAPDETVTSRLVPWRHVVYEHDPEQFIHLIESDEGDAIAEQVARFDNYLHDLSIDVSTGPVVDFRSPDLLRAVPDDDTVPLLYPTHLREGTVEWPHENAKWNALVLNPKSYGLTVATGTYVLVKRFTAKEERRRVVASVCTGAQFSAERLGLENHLNYFHENGHGLGLELARGLALYLNSTLVDMYFRQFSGHTQVNATDLRYIPYPARERLEAAGRAVTPEGLAQGEIDQAVEQYLLD